jgi:hypothetical protein
VTVRSTVPFDPEQLTVDVVVAALIMGWLGLAVTVTGSLFTSHPSDKVIFTE